MSEEKLPLSEVITVKDHQTVYKTNDWWCAVVAGEQFGRTKVFLYLWHKKDGKWKRKQKFTIGSKRNWNDIKPIVERFTEKFFGGQY